jgi:diguanylate cyclase (GGDEF)-like protein
MNVESDDSKQPKKPRADARGPATDSQQIDELRAENEKLRRQLDELRLTYQYTMEHGTFIENELEERVRETTLLSLTDPLTGIYNRLKFNQSLNGELQRRAAEGNMPCLIMFDIDHFKVVNDTYGHHVGDTILVELIKLVNHLIRKGDVLARWGGEEFVLLTTDMDLKGNKAIAERIRAEIQSFRFPKVGTITCSFGVAQMLATDSAEEIFRRVDRALYMAKESGRNCVVAL